MSCPVFCALCMHNDSDPRSCCFVCRRTMCGECAAGAFMCRECHAKISQQGLMPACAGCCIASLNLEQCSACSRDVCEVCREFCAQCVKHYCAEHECPHQI